LQNCRPSFLNANAVENNYRDQCLRKRTHHDNEGGNRTKTTTTTKKKPRWGSTTNFWFEVGSNNLHPLALVHRKKKKRNGDEPIVSPCLLFSFHFLGKEGEK
jgi:hypothetical protein